MQPIRRTTPCLTLTRARHQIDSHLVDRVKVAPRNDIHHWAEPTRAGHNPHRRRHVDRKCGRGLKNNHALTNQTLSRKCKNEPPRLELALVSKTHEPYAYICVTHNICHVTYTIEYIIYCIGLCIRRPGPEEFAQYNSLHNETSTRLSERFAPLQTVVGLVPGELAIIKKVSPFVPPARLTIPLPPRFCGSPTPT